MHLNPTALMYLAEARYQDDHAAQRSQPTRALQTDPTPNASRTQSIVNTHYLSRLFGRVFGFAG